MRSIRSRAAVGAIIAGLALSPALASCGQAAEQAAEMAAEQAMEGEGENVDITDDGMTVTDDQGNEMAMGQDVALPDNWPAAVPVADGTLQMVSVQSGGDALAVWVVEGTPAEAAAAYAAQLESAGYTEDSASNMDGLIVNQYSGNDLMVGVQAYDTDGSTTLTVTAESSS